MATSHSIPPILWRPSDPEATSMAKYRRHVNSKFQKAFRNTRELQRWSVQSPHDFWIDLYTYLELQPPLPPSITEAYDDTVPMSSNPPFFSGHEINYTENAIFANPDPDAIALIGIQEGQDINQGSNDSLTWRQFRERVRQTVSALRRSGIKKGDRVGALVATSHWVIILYHAAAAIGAIFTSISPELGLEGCVSRLKQVTPSILFVDSHAIYKGKAIPTADKLERIATQLSPKPQIYVIPTAPSSTPSKFASLDDFLANSRASDPLTFTRVPFSYPLMICYSSGTTGAPKCIVHSHGLIIQVKKISTLHNSLTPKDIVMQYSSTSWVVFYVMCGHFSVGAALVVYNGSPLYPDASQLLRICSFHHVTFLGASPRLLLEMEMSKTIPKHEFNLSSLKIVYTTGATLGIEQYRWFYRTFPPSVHICNTAGGTDTATSLIALDPCGPVYEGEMQTCALGMDTDVADPVTGASIAHTGEAGELVIRKPFPSMPCFFWGDSDGSKYREAYFERFDNIDVWAQHDWVSQNPKTFGLMLHGRSDGVLNPSGIRFGSGEIYSIVETAPFTDQISNTLCVGRRRPQDGDESVFLFVVMKPGYTLTPALRNDIKMTIKNALSARHVPRFVLAVPDIPTTINGKKVEIAVKQVLGGKDVTPSATVQNPESLKYFERFRTLESEPREVKL